MARAFAFGIKNEPWNACAVPILEDKQKMVQCRALALFALSASFAVGFVPHPGARLHRPTSTAMAASTP